MSVKSISGDSRAEYLRPRKALNGGRISSVRMSREARLTAPEAGALPVQLHRYGVNWRVLPEVQPSKTHWDGLPWPVISGGLN
jgi:hypothetical protein